jgi:hypothetical protein
MSFEDAQEYLAALITKMNCKADYDEVNLSIDLGHVLTFE